MRDTGNKLLALFHVASGLLSFSSTGMMVSTGPLSVCGRFSIGRGEVCGVWQDGDVLPRWLIHVRTRFDLGCDFLSSPSPLLLTSSTLQLSQQAQFRAHHPTPWTRLQSILFFSVRGSSCPCALVCDHRHHQIHFVTHLAASAPHNHRR